MTLVHISFVLDTISVAAGVTSIACIARKNYGLAAMSSAVAAMVFGWSGFAFGIAAVIMGQ